MVTSEIKKPLYILGINESHVSTAALLKNGEIIACASEERFTRKKGQWGFPKLAITYCLKEAGIESKDLDLVYTGFSNPTIFINEEEAKKTKFISVLKYISPLLRKILQKLSRLYPITYDIYETIYNTIFRVLFLHRIESLHKTFIANKLSINKNKIFSMDHHLAHAYAGYYANPDYQTFTQKNVAIITNDGVGDDVCSRIYSVKNNIWKEIASTSNKYSIGVLYQYVTEYMGMKPNEHEYKVMGLAPYADVHGVKKVLKKFQPFLWVQGLSIKSIVPTFSYYNSITKMFEKCRFDWIAGGIQTFTEQILLSLTKNVLKSVKTTTLILSGGVFMNVKANMEIGIFSNVKQFFVMPSCGDESTAIGAAYYGYRKLSDSTQTQFNPKPLHSLYLGPSFSDKEVNNSILKYKKEHAINIKHMNKPSKEIAQLLASGSIIARCKGRMEFGARALGNRSILADPSNREVIRIINEQIKGRDFWMPFAPVIMDRFADIYLKNPKQFTSSFMMLGFETTKKARQDIIASLHPYDFTARPQILSKNQNPDYYDIISEFYTITGIGGLLNTSFNIHGEPIVCSPDDALYTFFHSGLTSLVLNDYLITKKKI
jgi:carbamoyltransferase